MKGCFLAGKKWLFLHHVQEGIVDRILCLISTVDHVILFTSLILNQHRHNAC